MQICYIGLLLQNVEHQIDGCAKYILMCSLGLNGGNKLDVIKFYVVIESNYTYRICINIS
jgi:hypothetical protein